MKQARPLISEALSVVTLTCDPGFSEFGYGLVRFDKVSRQHALLHAGVILTKPSAKKRSVRATEDNFERLREIAQTLRRVCAPYSVRLISLEAFSFPPKAGKVTLVKMAYPYGALAMLAVLWDIPTIMPTPQEVKKAMCGVQSASKEDVEQAVCAQIERGVNAWQAAGPVEQWLGHVLESRRNHVFDALAVYMAAQESDVARALRA